MACLPAIEEAVAVLNRIHAADPSVLPRLIDHRVECNQTLARDPTVQVGRIDGADDRWEVGLLGIVNGLFGVQGPRNFGYIGAVYDGHVLTHFTVLGGGET